MKKLKDKDDYVRVVVGKVKSGEKNMSKPLKSISVKDTNVEEVFDKIDKMLDKESEEK